MYPLGHKKLTGLKMKKSIHILIIFTLIISVSFGCATSYEQSGALTGAAVGAAVGSTIGRGRNQAFAIWLGAVVG